MESQKTIGNVAEMKVMSKPMQVIIFCYEFFTGIVPVLGPNSSKELIDKRKTICEGECYLKDLSGDRLFRKEEGEGQGLFCGVPILKRRIRDPKREGCGCFLKLKWKKKWTSCPNKLW